MSRGADPHEVDSNGWNALHFASHSGNVLAIDLFLSEGINVNCAAKDGRTPLMNAALAGQTDAATFLLFKGANLHALNSNGCL